MLVTIKVDTFSLGFGFEENFRFHLKILKATIAGLNQLSKKAKKKKLSYDRSRVKGELRNYHLAIAFLRQKKYSDTENKASTLPNISAITNIIFYASSFHYWFAGEKEGQFKQKLHDMITLWINEKKDNNALG